MPACAGTASRVRDVLVIDGLLLRCRRAAAWLCILQQGTCYSGVELVVEVCIHSESTKSQSSSSGEVIEPASARATIHSQRGGTRGRSPKRWLWPIGWCFREPMAWGLLKAQPDGRTRFPGKKKKIGRTHPSLHPARNHLLFKINPQNS